MWIPILVLSALVLVTGNLEGEQRIAISVDAAARGLPFRNIWPYFGCDEPNFTYAKDGRRLLSELSALSPAPVYIRTHNLLTSGDGTPALKWGSTNIYTEDPSGQAVYDWTIIDKIFDAFLQAKVRPLVEIGFMPEALSVRPQPYRHMWPQGILWTGWAYPPKDYGKWAELIYRWVCHCIDRYGKDEVQSWYWGVWNEPDIGYWQGTPEDYYKLYDHTTEAVKRALPEARVGGPHSTGPADPRAAEFLRRFLEHCAHGTNYATGRRGAPLDFIAFHAKGSPKLVEGHVRMGMSRHLQSIDKGFQIVASFPEFRMTPVILGESDPEGCAACSAREHPANAYRNGLLYPCYTAATLARILELADRHHVNITAVVTWAFEFENQPYFAGYRSLATNGIDKPILNVFRMFGLLAGEQIPVVSTHAVALDSILQSGVLAQPEVSAIATREDRNLAVLAWNYHDDDIRMPGAPVEIIIKGLPGSANRVLVHHYRIDAYHSNAYTVWKELGSPQSLDAEQYSRLASLGHLQLLTSPEWMSPEQGQLRLRFALPRHATSLIRVSW